MAKAKLYTPEGAYKQDVELPASHFDVEVSEPVLFQATYIYLGNQRQGTHKTKNRSEVSGGGKKPWKQKGTGGARQGSNTAPQFARGGKAHGPQPRKYTKDLSQKMKQKAFTSALTLKARENSVSVFEGLGVSAPKTSQLAGILKKAEMTGGKNLIVIDQPEGNLLLAARNLPNTRIERVQDVHAYVLMNSERVIFTTSALKALVEVRG
ncbi:MAG: rplD [Fibrobacteria bacterium]|jgi:large subunit ribosomal protein L4|nr:rplD [Fibrobacteria bacterium]